MHDEDAVLLTDAAATGYFGAQLGNIAAGDTVVVPGAGPGGLIAAEPPRLMGARRGRGAERGTAAGGDPGVVLGAGPVGLIAAQSSWLMGAGRVIVVDHLQERLAEARSMGARDTPEHQQPAPL